MEKLSEEQIKKMMGTVMDGPGMTYNGWQEFSKIKGTWKSADGRFELQCRENGDATFLARGKAALDVRLNLLSRNGMGMMMAMGSQPAPVTHEIEFVFQFNYRVLDAEGTPLFRLGKAWYDADTLTITLTDMQTDTAQEIPLIRQEEPASIDLTAPIPRFCPNCGHPMEGKRICGSCGWRVGS